MSKFSPFICPVNGVTFHPEAVYAVREGDRVELIRQPDNQYDPNAIAVFSNSSQLGFIPATLSSRLSATHAQSWVGLIEKIYDHNENRGLRIKITDQIGLSEEDDDVEKFVHSTAGRYLGTLVNISGNKARIKAQTGRIITYPVNVISIS